MLAKGARQRRLGYEQLPEESEHGMIELGGQTKAGESKVWEAEPAVEAAGGKAKAMDGIVEGGKSFRGRP